MELLSKTIGQCLYEQVLGQGEKLALEAGDFSCSFLQLDEMSDALALRMEKLNIVRGTHVGIWGVNTPDWIVVFLALVKIGAVPVLINTCYRQEEMKGILASFDVEVLYYGHGYRELVYEEILSSIRTETSGVRHEIPMDGLAGGLTETLTGEQLLHLNEIKASVSPKDPACMIFTSGTTAVPKGVLLTHYNLVNNARAMVKAMHWTNRDKMCITVPMFHCFGVTAGIVSCIVAGMQMHLLKYFRTAQVWDAVERSGCTVLNGVPSMFLALIRKQQYDRRDGGRLRSGIIAGSPVTPDEYKEICGRFPDMHLQPSYGQTETSPCVTIADWDEPLERKACSAGKVIDHVKVRIVDLETGAELAYGQDGEIQIQGYNVMAGYYKRPDANQKVFTEDGWLRSGDIGHMDESGELHITGRLKEMIIRAGENISPQEIEMVIRKLDWVDQVKVVGVPAQVRQEEIAACVIPKAGRLADEEGLKAYLEPRLAHYKIPAYVLAFEEFPMNASGKINLKKLKILVKEAVDEVTAQSDQDLQKEQGGNKEMAEAFFTEQHELIRKLARDFAEKELTKEILDQVEENEEFPEEILAKMAKAGFFGVKIPKELGGQGADARSYVLVMEEIARVSGVASIYVSSPNSLSGGPLLMAGNDEQKEKYLRPVVTGQKKLAFALTEPGAGSDAGAVATAAKREGDHYVLNGRKCFITMAPLSDYAVVFAKTDVTKGNKGLSAFVVDMHAEGVSCGKPEKKMGVIGCATSDIILDNVIVPVCDRLGEEGDGFKIAMQTLNTGRLGVSAQAIGVAQGCLDEAIRYAKERKQFGRRIGDFQAISFMIAEMATKLEAAKQLVYKAAYMMDTRQDATMNASMAKYYASEICNEIAQKAVQIHGGYGFIKDYKIERMFRDCRVFTIYEGTSQVQQMVIGSKLLKK